MQGEVLWRCVIIGGGRWLHRLKEAPNQPDRLTLAELGHDDPARQCFPTGVVEQTDAERWGERQMLPAQERQELVSGDESDAEGLDGCAIESPLFDVRECRGIGEQAVVVERAGSPQNCELLRVAPAGQRWCRGVKWRCTGSGNATRDMANPCSTGQ